MTRECPVSQWKFLLMTSKHADNTVVLFQLWALKMHFVAPEDLINRHPMWRQQKYLSIDQSAVVFWSKEFSWIIFWGSRRCFWKYCGLGGAIGFDPDRDRGSETMDMDEVWKWEVKSWQHWPCLRDYPVSWWRIRPFRWTRRNISSLNKSKDWSISQYQFTTIKLHHSFSWPVPISSFPEGFVKRTMWRIKLVHFSWKVKWFRVFKMFFFCPRLGLLQLPSENFRNKSQFGQYTTVIRRQQSWSIRA